MDAEELIAIAQTALQQSYSPYSKFKVGSAVLTKQGKAITGCNIENVAFSPTMCAERLAIFKAISEGYKDFEMIVVATEANKLTPPCGTCRQVMTEFCDEDFKIILANTKSKRKEYYLKDLIPLPFKPEDLD